jgi:lipopolysaccharide transport system ATP-binding protein
VIEEYLGGGGHGSGEVSWESPSLAPGDERARLRSVRVKSGEVTTGEVDIESAFSVEVDNWNLEPDSRRAVSLHIYDSKGICVLTTANYPSISLVPDPLYGRPLPRGVFRTTCTFPGRLLNDGLYYLNVFVQGAFIKDTLVRVEQALSFIVRDHHVMEREFTGEWLGVVRPTLDWRTIQVGDSTEEAIG